MKLENNKFFKYCKLGLIKIQKKSFIARFQVRFDKKFCKKQFLKENI